LNKICTFDAKVSKGFSIHATFQKVQKLKSWLKAFNSACLILYAKFPLSDEEENQLWEEINELEEVKGMSYITSVERIGMRKGLLEDGREMVLEALDERFGEVPSFISNVVTKIEDRDMLKFLHRHAIRCASLEEFKQALNGKK